MPVTADVVVIGAGVHGASTAFFLASKGARRVMLVDKEGVAAGATGRSACIVRMHYTNPWDASLALRSWQMFQQWQEMVGGSCGFRRTGVLFLAGHHDAEHLRANVRMLQGVGVNTRVITNEEARKLHPMINLDDVGAAAYEPDGGYADGVDTTNSLVQRARELGVTVRLGSPVRSIVVRGGKVMGVSLEDTLMETPVVVLAAGAWCAALARTAGVELPVIGRRLGAGILQRPLEVGDHPVILERVLGFYYRPEGAPEARMTLLGIEDPQEAEAADPDSYPGSPSYASTLQAIQRLAHRVPAMTEAYWKRTWSGVDGYTPDHHGIVGAVPGVEGLYVSAGWSGTGFKTGPAVGEALAELILGGRTKTVDVTGLRVARFAEGKPLASAHEYRYLPLP